MEMDAVMRRGTCIAIGTLDGNEFDWIRREWKRRA